MLLFSRTCSRPGDRPTITGFPRPCSAFSRGVWRGSRGPLTLPLPHSYPLPLPLPLPLPPHRHVSQVGLLKSLRSPNIVELHTCFLHDNVLWVVMEWVDGGDLKGELTAALLVFLGAVEVEAVGDGGGWVWRHAVG